VPLVPDVPLVPTFPERAKETVIALDVVIVPLLATNVTPIV
jgi:hypothetical protein